MILVAGASGMIGGEVCRLLRAQRRPVRALVRRTTDETKLRELERIGVELVVGDVRDRGSLDAACRGVSSVVSAVTSIQSRIPGDSMRTVEREGQINLIDAARAQGVEHFIPSSYGIRPERIAKECPLVDAKVAAERHLTGSGIAYTIIYASLVMEAWLSPMLGFDPAEGRARIYGTGRAPLCWLSFRDVAQVIVHCVTHERYRDRTLEVGGPEALTPLEVVRIFEEESGRRFEVEHVPEETLLTMEAGAQDPLQKTVAVLFQAYARGHVVDMGELRAELPVRWTTVREHARRVYAPAAPIPAPPTG